MGTIIEDSKKDSFIANMEGLINFNANYFESTKTEMSAKKDFRGTLQPQGDAHELYYPRIFSIIGNQVSLELYVGIHDRQKCLMLEVRRAHMIDSFLFYSFWR